MFTLFTSQNAMQLKQTCSIFCNNSNPSNKKLLPLPDGKPEQGHES